MQILGQRDITLTSGYLIAARFVTVAATSILVTDVGDKCVYDRFNTLTATVRLYF